MYRSVGPVLRCPKRFKSPILVCDVLSPMAHINYPFYHQPGYTYPFADSPQPFSIEGTEFGVGITLGYVCFFKFVL